MLCLLFTQIYFITFKVCPFRKNTHTPRKIQSSKHFLNAVLLFFLMSFTECKRVPRRGNLSLGKRKKSAGALSGEYDGCSMIFVECLFKNSQALYDHPPVLQLVAEILRIGLCRQLHVRLYKIVKLHQ
jgi:hypothetical protein